MKESQGVETRKSRASVSVRGSEAIYFTLAEKGSKASLNPGALKKRTGEAEASRR